MRHGLPHVAETGTRQMDRKSVGSRRPARAWQAPATTVPSHRARRSQLTQGIQRAYVCNRGAGMGGFLGPFLGKLFADELRGWLPWFQQRAIQAAVRKLPSEQKERYNEEWRSHLNEVPGEIAKTWVALGFLRAAKEISSRRKFD